MTPMSARNRIVSRSMMFSSSSIGLSGSAAGPLHQVGRQGVGASARTFA
jgi:hypothetical protein